jgi:PAS domain S-box-containing protein
MLKRSLSDKPIQEDKFLNALAEAFRLQESILNATDLAILSTTPEGVITSFNRSCEHLLGYTASEVIGTLSPLKFHDAAELMKQAQSVTPESEKHIEPMFSILTRQAQSQKEPDKKEWTLIRKDGTSVPASISVVALRDDHENLLGFAELITDITEQVKIRERIFASEEKFRLLAENIPGAIYLCHKDANHSVIYFNDHIEKITGYPVTDFLSGKITYASLFHPDDSKMIYETIDQKVAERKSFHLRYRIRHASGEWRWVDEAGAGVYVNDHLTMLEGFISDITLEKKAEEKHQKVAEENLRFFNNPVNLNALSDFHGTLQRISPSWSQLLGWTENELKSKPFLEFLHPEDVETSTGIFKSLTEGMKVLTFENRIVSKAGAYHWLLWGAASDPKTQIIYASAIDITDRKRSEANILDSKTSLETIAQKLQEQNRKLDEFAHIISHNLRAPVSNIQALINLLGDNSSISDYKIIFDKLKNVAKNLSETMNELMDTLKAKTHPNVDLTEIRFKEILDKVVQSLEGELIVAEAAVTFDFNDAPAIMYSKPYLESIFQNLLTNAIKYHSPARKPLIHFKSSLGNDYIELKVEDNGQGIDMERFGDKLFGLHKTFHNHDEARGVGLFLVKTQIEAMGGKIKAESEVDKGTAFIIRFAN